MIEKRDSSRIQRKEFRNHRVQMTVGSRVYIGSLGDISESGLSMLVQGMQPIYIEESPQLKFAISGPHLAAPMRLLARMQRQAVIEVRGCEYLLVGVRFEEPVVLPDSMIALAIASDIA